MASKPASFSTLSASSPPHSHKGVPLENLVARLVNFLVQDSLFLCLARSSSSWGAPGKFQNKIGSTSSSPKSALSISSTLTKQQASQRGSATGSADVVTIMQLSPYVVVIGEHHYIGDDSGGDDGGANTIKHLVDIVVKEEKQVADASGPPSRITAPLDVYSLARERKGRVTHLVYLGDVILSEG